MPTLAEASLSDLERVVIDRFVVDLKRELGEALDSVWLYGSRARGETPGEDSDVDLLVLVEDLSPRIRSQVSATLHDAAWAESADGPYFSVHTHDREWLEGRRAIKSFFIEEVDRDKIILHGGP